MDDQKVIGLDLGATNIRGGLIHGNRLSQIHSRRIQSAGTVEEVLEDIYAIIDLLIEKEVAAIGIGVPSVVDVEQGIVYDVQYIPSWKEVHLKTILEERYHVPVFVNNDANCFVLGEYYFGKGAGIENLVGLAIGTGTRCRHYHQSPFICRSQLRRRRIRHGGLPGSLF